jgi:hypothetical protein
VAPAPQRDGPSEPSPQEYQLKRAKDGSGDLIYDATTFDARIARDGSVSFRDRRVTGLKLLPFLPGAAPTGVPTLEGVIRALGKNQRKARGEAPPDPTADETRYPSTTVSRFRPDTREICRYPNPCFFNAPVLSLGAQGNFDVTDQLMRLAGQDPYRYQKARFLTATREMRVRMAGRAHAEDVARSGVELRGRLESIACDERLGASERRAIVEALRAELDVATPEGRAQRDQIRRFLDGLDRADGGVPCRAR